MRTYIAKIKLKPEEINASSGYIAEIAFERWFKNNYQGEAIYKQCADMDHKGIDFACEKGITYQVKGSVGKTFTFNCNLDDLREHLKASLYVCIQVKEKVAYIESIYSADDILALAKESYKFKGSCFIWAKDLKQYKLEI